MRSMSMLRVEGACPVSAPASIPSSPRPPPASQMTDPAAMAREQQAQTAELERMVPHGGCRRASSSEDVKRAVVGAQTP